MSDGQVITHELGHVEGWILFPLNTFFIAQYSEKQNSGGHSDGDKSGEQADIREDEYEAK